MKRIFIACAVLTLTGCPAPSKDSWSAPVQVRAVVADNGVPCVLALAGNTGVAISCDWSTSQKSAGSK